MGSVTHVEADKKVIEKEVHKLAQLVVRLEDSLKDDVMVCHTSDLSLVVGVKSKQHVDPLLTELKETVLSKANESFSQG